MKKWISLLLVVVLTVTAVSMAVSAEEPQRAFVIDGKLDEWYRSDFWAIENGFHDSYGMEFEGKDTTLDVLSKDPLHHQGIDPVALYEEVTVEIYAAYDEHYAYFYVDVYDPDIATYEVTANGVPVPDDNGNLKTHSQYIESIDFYVDTDYGSISEGDFFQNCELPDHADTHFRMHAHDMYIGDCRNRPKYSLEQEDFTTESTYFSSKANVFPFQHFNEAGDLIGYGCEARFPLAYYYGRDEYVDVYYNIAVINHVTQDAICCAITTGQEWWHTYDMSKGRLFNMEDCGLGYEANPFFFPDQQQTSSGGSQSGSTVSTPSTPSTPTVIRGDVDGNTRVNASDALLALKSSVGKVKLTETQFKAADLDGNNIVNASDALGILKISVGK